jgi:hypothetical protein
VTYPQLTPRIPLPKPVPGQNRYGTEMDDAIAGFANSVMRCNQLDPVLTEFIRLRCARVHDCRLCQSLRTDAATAGGLDELTAEKIDRYETSDLPESVKVALRFTDAAIMGPGTIDATLRADVRRHFTAPQIAEMALDIMKWSHQKALVALRIEVPLSDGVSVLSFDETGRPHVTITPPVEVGAGL